MKSGCNFADRNEIKRYVAVCLEEDKDIDIEFISKSMLIQEEAVASWVKHYVAELTGECDEDEDEDEDLPE